MVERLNLQKIMRTPSRASVIRINLMFLAFFLVIYSSLLPRPSSSLYFDNAASLVGCSLHQCHHKMKAALEERKVQIPKPRVNKTKIKAPSFINDMGNGMKIGAINMDEDGDDIGEWKLHGEIIPIQFQRLSRYFKWEDLFPEWIDEEEENDVPSCPEIPMPNFEDYDTMDLIVAKLPCKRPEEGWNRDVLRLQIHLVTANLAVKKGKMGWNGRTKVVLWGNKKCRPMLELFRCDDLVRREGDWWFYEPEIARLEWKVSLPVGSCKLSLPLWAQGENEVHHLFKIQTIVRTPEREAYATVLHSSESYVCGAIALSQSLLQTGTKRDLILLLDKSISRSKRDALAAAGWKIRLIKRIRNPGAKRNSYNEYNYSKFRLWQLTDYDKIIFLDSDILVLRNLDVLFHFPQMSATGNNIWIFNSGIMVIEPSNCTFKLLMDRRRDIISYNGGDQGFLNEVFVWWHRLPRRTNFLKNCWSNSTAEASVKNELFGADPPKLYAIHYLGLKPWHCYRDYDCNWNIGDQRVYASDVAHERWWKFHDKMDVKLQKYCGLTKNRKRKLDWKRKLAKDMRFSDGHWKINVSDPRRVHLI